MGSPYAGMGKFNCEASLKVESQGEGLGRCVRDHNGSLIRSAACYNSIALSVMIGDLKAIALDCRSY